MTAIITIQAMIIVMATMLVEVEEVVALPIRQWLQQLLVEDMGVEEVVEDEALVEVEVEELIRW